MEASKDNLGDAINVDVGPFFRKVFKFSYQLHTFNSSLKFYGGFDANNFQDQVSYDAVIFYFGKSCSGSDAYCGYLLQSCEKNEYFIPVHAC